MTTPRKFRAWHPEHGMTDEVTVFGDGHYYANYDAEIRFLTADDGVILMQYTGMEDMYGTEIWEGDIIHYIYEYCSLADNKMVTREIVEPVIFQFGFFHMAQRGMDVMRHPLITKDNFKHRDVVEYKVLDNIYQNPELVT